MVDVERWSLAQQVCLDMGRLVFGAAFRLRVEGSERIPRRGGTLIVSNHPTMLDPVLLALIMPRPMTYLADDTPWRYRSVGHFLDLFGCVPIAKGESAVTVVRQAVRAVRRGSLVIVFPEGGLSDHGKLRRFRAGAARIAVEAGCPVVPAAVCGSYAAWPYGSVMPRSRPVTVRFGQPLELRRYYRRPRSNSLLHHLAAEMEQAVEALYTPWDPRRPPAAQRNNSSAASNHSR